MFELSQLRCFVAVAEELHFGRAAERLNMTQPPLSRQIRLLEHLLEARLFERSSRHVALTYAGRSLLPEARRILQLAESAAISIKRTTKGEAGTVAIGFTAASGYDFLPSVMRVLQAEQPDVDFVLREGVTGIQLDDLSAGRLDIALVRPPVVGRHYESRIVLSEPLILAIPADHPLAGLPRIDAPALADASIIGYSPFEARYFHDLVSQLLLDEGLWPRFVQHVSQIHSILALVRTGLGVALVPIAARQLHFEGVVYRPIRTRNAHPVELSMVWRTDLEIPAAKRALGIILAFAGRNGGARQTARP